MAKQCNVQGKTNNIDADDCFSNSPEKYFLEFAVPAVAHHRSLTPGFIRPLPCTSRDAGVRMTTTERGTRTESEPHIACSPLTPNEFLSDIGVALIGRFWPMSSNM